MSGLRSRSRCSHPGFAVRLLFAIITSCCATGFAADIKVRLRNDLTPGNVVVYDVRIRGERTTPTLQYTEQVTFEQPGELTLVVLEKPDPRHARRVWMMTLEVPRVVALTRDGQPVDEPPSAKTLGLPPQASQLRLATITTEAADASPVGGSRVQRAALLLALDFARWPDRLVAVGEHWETPTQRAELAGAWTHGYAGTTGRGSERLALGTFAFDGTLAGPFANVAEIERVRGTWQWRVAKRGLESSTSEVVLSYGPPAARRRLSFNVELTLRSRERLAKPALEQARADLQALAEAAGSTAAPTEDRAALERFVAERPKSLWLPVAHHLLERVKLNTEALAPLDRDDLRETLTALVTRWQRTAIEGAVEALQPVRATFRELTKTNRTELYALVGDEDRNMRAMAVFCVAFGDQPGDLAKVVATCTDDEPRVRMWAAYGLAERRDPATDVDVLYKLLRDDAEKVRRRACMAVTTCVKRGSPQRARFVKRLLKMVNSDPVDEVRPFAAQALAALAKRADLKELIDAEARQEVPEARWQLEETIRKLGGKPRR